MSFKPDAAMPGLFNADFGCHVSGCAFSQDGRNAAFALGDGTVALFFLDTSETTRITAHQGAALAMAGSGRGFLTGGDDGRVMLTSPDGATQELGMFPGCWIEHVAASAAGDVLAASLGKQIALFPQGETKPHLFPELPSSIGGLAASPDGRALAASHYDGVTVYAPPRPGNQGNKFDGQGSNLTLVFAADGSKMACATQDKSVRVYDLDQAAGYLLEGYPSKVRCLSFSSSGDMLWTGGEQAFVGWPVDASVDPSKREAKVFGAFEHGMLGAVAAHPALPLVAGGFDGGIIFMGSPERNGAAPLLVVEGRRVTCLTWSPDGRRLAGGTDGGGAFAFDLAGAAK